MTSNCVLLWLYVSFWVCVVLMICCSQKLLSDFNSRNSRNISDNSHFTPVLTDNYNTISNMCCVRNNTSKEKMSNMMWHFQTVCYDHVTCVTASVLSVCQFRACTRIPGRHAAAGLHRPQTGMCVCSHRCVCVCADETSHTCMHLRRRDPCSDRYICVGRWFLRAAFASGPLFGVWTLNLCLWCKCEVMWRCVI